MLIEHAPSFLIKLCLWLTVWSYSCIALGQNSEAGSAESGYAWEGGVAVSEKPRPVIDSTMTKLNPEEHEYAESLRISHSRSVRRFHEVLDELLAEFAYDIKMGQINGLKNI